MRNKLWIFLKSVSKTPEGAMIPKWLYMVRFILYPIDCMFWMKSKNTGYQLHDDTWLIEGIRYSSKLMRHFSCGGDEVFRIIKRENGCITIEQIYGQIKSHDGKEF